MKNKKLKIDGWREDCEAIGMDIVEFGKGHFRIRNKFDFWPVRGKWYNTLTGERGQLAGTKEQIVAAIEEYNFDYGSVIDRQTPKDTLYNQYLAAINRNK